MQNEMMGMEERTIMMPMKKNIPEGKPGWTEVKCPTCGGACWETEFHKMVMKDAPPKIKGECTECALRASLQKGNGNIRLDVVRHS